VAYSPWSNGTIEVVCGEVLCGLRSLISELKLQFCHWPTLVPVIQSILNNQIVDRLDGMDPVTSMTSLPPTTPLLSFLSPFNDVDVITLDQIKAERLANLRAVQCALESLHKALSQTTSAKRDRRRSNKHSASKAAIPMFSIGDFALMGTSAPEF
jgi:hypothetical protein